MRGLEWYKNLYQKFDRKTDYAKVVVNLHNKRVLLAPDPVSKSTLLLCTINKNEYLSKYYLQFSNFFCVHLLSLSLSYVYITYGEAITRTHISLKSVHGPVR